MSAPVLTITIDRQSLLVTVDGDASLDAIEARVLREGLTLGLAPFPEATTVADWLARGAPGAASVFADPADHVVAGLEATFRDGRHLVVREGPRRAVGPDLVALFVGAGERFGRIVRATLRVHAVDAARPSLSLPRVDLDPPIAEDEAKLLAAIDDALRR